MISVPTAKKISLHIEPNYSSWETIELSYQCVKDCIDREIEGDVVECGVACGNNFAAMCFAGRHGVGFDSFEGIPWAGEFDDCQPGFTERPTVMNGKSSGMTAHTLEDSTANMIRWGISDYEFVKGWFSDTIPDQKYTSKIAVLRLDGDLYESTFIPLVHLYPLLSKGGILIIDDWNLAGCKMAFKHYFQRLPSHLWPDEILTYGNPIYLKKP